MNDAVQNKIVEQKDILGIISILNNFYKEKMNIFEKTKKDIEDEEEAYADWNNKRWNSNDIANYPKFEYKTHTNKLTHESFTFSFYCVDGLTYEDKSYKEAQIIMSSGYSSFEKIVINLDMSWQKTYNSQNFTYTEKNNANVSVYITFYKDDVFTKYSTKNADGDIRYLKSEISDIFDNLKPKYSKIIAKRESIKYQSTLAYSFYAAAGLIIFLSIMFQKMEVNFGFSGWQFILFIASALVLNMFIPPTKLNSLYKQIIPKKKTIYQGTEAKKVDNIKDFKRTAEVHIGENATKSGKRKQIEEIYKKSQTANAISLFISIVIVFIASIIF